MMHEGLGAVPVHNTLPPKMFETILIIIDSGRTLANSSVVKPDRLGESPSPPFTSCVTMGRLLHLSVLQFPHLKTGNNDAL